MRLSGTIACMAEYELGMIGFGNMGQAIAAGIVNSGFIPARKIALYDIDPRKIMTKASNYGMAFVNLDDLSSSSNNILLAVKPQQIDEVLAAIKKEISAEALVISIAAGIKISAIARMLPDNPIVRSMPNTPAFVSKSVTAIAASSNCSPDHISFAINLFSSIGKVVRVDEKDMDAVTAVSGSGPAYFFEFTRLMAESATNLGLSGEVANQLAAETLIGAAALVEQSGSSLEELRNMVTSKGGTTEAALNSLNSNNLDELIMKALEAARNRAIELSGE